MTNASQNTDDVTAGQRDNEIQGTEIAQNGTGAASGASQATTAKQLMALLKNDYGRDVYRIIPKAWRHDSHRDPSLDFLRALGKLVRLHTADPVPLAYLRATLSETAKYRLRHVVDAGDSAYILKSDILHAIEVREILVAESDEEIDSSILDARVWGSRYREDEDDCEQRA